MIALKRHIPYFLMMVLLTCAFSVGCGGKQGFVSPYPEKPAERAAFAVTSGEELRLALRDRTRFHDELWVKSDIKIRQEGKKGTDFFSALVAFKAPAQLRLRGSRAPIGTVFEVLLDGNDAGLYFNREKRLFIGTVAELLEKAEMLGGMTPMDLVSAVFVLQNLRDWYGAAMTMIERDLGQHLLIGSRVPSGVQFLWLVRKEDGLVRELLIRSAQGDPLLRIKYQEYRMVGNPDRFEEPMPFKFTMHLESKGRWSRTLTSTGSTR